MEATYKLLCGLGGAGQVGWVGSCALSCHCQLMLRLTWAVTIYFCFPKLRYTLWKYQSVDNRTVLLYDSNQPYISELLGRYESIVRITFGTSKLAFATVSLLNSGYQI